jgi:hypothetical protein
VADAASGQLQTLCEYFSQWDEYAGTIFYDEFDAAFIGFGWQFNIGPVAIYREDRVLEILMDRGLDEEEALDHYSFNVTGAYVGERTPIFMTHHDDVGVEEIQKRAAGAELSGWGKGASSIKWELGE